MEFLKQLQQLFGNSFANPVVLAFLMGYIISLVFGIYGIILGGIGFLILKVYQNKDTILEKAKAATAQAQETAEQNPAAAESVTL